MEKNWSVVIATYNAMTYLPRLLQALEKQANESGGYSQEILLVDGGSTDGTIEFAQKEQVRLIDNPKGDPVSGKFLGFMEAKSDFIAFLDQDEELVDPKSLERKFRLLSDYSELFAASSSGYVVDASLKSSQNYISEFGDPFSCFFYRTSQAAARRETSLQNAMAGMPLPSHNAVLFGGPRRPGYVLWELVSMGTMVARPRVLQLFSRSQYELVPEMLPHIFSVANKLQPFGVAFLRDDPVRHETSPSWGMYFAKLRWRVVNQRIGDRTSNHNSGFLGRASIEFGESARLIVAAATLFYVAYVLLVVPLIFHTLWLVFTRKQIGFLGHFSAAWVTLFWGLSSWASRAVGNPLVQKRYATYEGRVSEQRVS